MASSMLTAEATALASAEANVNEAMNTKMHSCANDPDFAVICDFLQKFSKDLGLNLPNFKQLLDWLTKTDEVSPQLREMKIKLLRKTRKTVHEKSWESALSKFCFTYSAQDAWEIERFGYKNASAKIKLRLLRELLECQFERNNKFRAKILTLSADSLRSQPIGRDRLGHAYWVTQDNDCNLRIYQEHLDEEIWQVVATNREEFVNLIKSLRGSEVVLPSADIGIVDEDTCSSSNTYSETQKSPPQKEQEDSQEDIQKVPKLSIKINHGRPSKDDNPKDVGKGEEELAAEEDAKILKKPVNCAEATESDEEEFEEAEDEYEDESDDEDDDTVEEDDEEKVTSVETELRKDTKKPEGTKKVKPLLISQSKIVNLPKCDTKADVSVAKKRTLDQVDGNSSARHNNEQINLIKKSRPSLLDSKRSKNLSKYEETNECGEEDYEDEDDNIDEEMEEEDIDSVAAEEDENEEKLFDDSEDDEENEVGEEISEPVLHVKGEGSGKECDVGNSFLNYDLDDNETIVSSVIEEAIIYIRGEGYGKECQVGNNKNESDTSNTIKSPVDTKENSSLKTQEDKSNLFLGEPEGKLSENLEHKNEISENIKSLEKTENPHTPHLDTNIDSNEINGQKSHKNTKNQTLVEKIVEPPNTGTSETKIIGNTNLLNDEKDEKLPKQPENLSIIKPPSIACNATDSILASKMSVLESLKKELRESKQKSIEKIASSTGESNKTKLLSSIALNRKRRIDNLTAQQNTNMRNSNSESEIDPNSENLEDLSNEPELDVDDLDVGGKRLKMRPKQTNSELRKKIEAQKVAANEENTSSSGGEEESRRKKKVFITKKLESTKHAEMSSKIDEKTIICADAATPSPPVNILKQNTLGKTKPTLTEIIEKKLKKNLEKVENECVSTSAVNTDDVRPKSIFSPLTKNPITKPLKKSFVRRDESVEDPVAKKRSTSENSLSSESTLKPITEDKEMVQKNGDNQQNSPERQRKRRSSEDTIKNEDPEEPEAKKEVNCEDNKKSITKTDTNILVKGEIFEDKKDVDVKEESISECLTPVAGRRSGRREGLTPAAIVENSQPKKARGITKNPTKKPTKITANCDEDIKEIKKENNDSKIENVTLEVKKEKTEEQKDSNIDDFEEIIKVDVLSKNKIKKSITSPPAKGFRKRRDVDATNIIEVTDNEIPVRQSRRIAQQKIREEAERRKLEEIALRTMKQELKKKKKAEKQVDPTVVPPITEPSSESEESDVETKRKVQKKKCPGKNGSWSSGSEEQEEPDEEDEEPPHYEIDPGSPLFKSDHEFSPESDIEDESQAVPVKRARTARKEDAAVDEPDEEEACQKCNKSDHPEWILLCDNCDKGYHCSCLSPVLFYIPEGDWYCPPCQQEQLIKALESHLKEFDDLVEHKRNEEEKEKLLAEEEKARQEEEIRNNKHNKNQKKKTKLNSDDSSGKDVSHSSQEDTDSDDSANSERRKSSTKNKKNKRLKNLKNNDKRNRRDRRQNRNARNRSHKRSSDSDSDSQLSSKRVSKSISSSTSSSSSSYSESDNEPIYKLRKRRQINVSYRLNEYDDLINSALKKEMDEAAGAGNLGRGKDISTIIEADKEEKARQKQSDEVEPTNDELSKPKSADENCKEKEESAVEIKAKKPEEKRESNNDDSDDEPINQKFNIKPSLKKKSRKLTTLDISSGDDDGSDEDFKGSSLDDEDDEDTSISASNSDSSLEIYKRHGKSRKKRRKAARRAFRERRKDRKFVVDESDDEEIRRPKSKKKRKDDSDYTESEADDDNSELSENIDSADLCDDTTSDESDGAWRPNKSKKAKKSSANLAHKSPKPKKIEVKKTKKIQYSDDDVSETEEDENDEESGGVGGGKEMGGKQPRSQPLKTSNTATKTKGKGGATSTKTKKKKKSSEDELSESGSEDSTRRTRGRRYAYMEDFDDESSDGGIKPGVQRPDTPPEEREKFIKRQEEIKRMLAEKNAEGAKLVATPRLTPIKTDSEKDKRSPVKASGDSLSTVPLSVIRQAKVLDIDYLQRRGENLDDLGTDVGEVDDDFDDADLPDDLPEDMDEDTIARMVEEEEEFGAAAARELPAPDEVLRAPPSIKPKTKEVDKPILVHTSTAPPFPPHTPQTPATLPPSSGLQEPIRKRLPMPTMHPPLLRHQFLLHDSIASAQHLMQRHSGPPTSHLLQSALSAPLTQPIERNYPSASTAQSHHSLANRMTHSIQLQPTVPHMIGTPRPSLSNTSKTTALIEHSGNEKSNNTRNETEMKPRGRRKKITPLRDTLQKQQAAAAVTAATATNSIMASASGNTNEFISTSVPSSVIKSGPPAKGHMETSVITSVPPSMPPVSSRPVVTMPSVSGIYSRTDGQRFYDSLANRAGVHRHRGPPQIPHSLLQPHPSIRSSYGPPPPLKGSNSVAGNAATSNAPGSIRPSVHHVPPYVGMPPNARHSSPHLNMYRQPIYGNPSFGPRVNLRPNMHSSEYSTGSRAYSPYGFYPPPPPLTTPGQGPPTSSLMPKIQPPISQPPTSVIVSASSAAASSKSAIIPSGPSSSVLCEHSSKSSTTKVSPSKSQSHVPQSTKVLVEPRKKLTTLQSYGATSPTKKSPLPPAGESSGSLSSPGLQSEVVDDSSPTPGLPDNSSKIEPSRTEGHASEFSGLVSYFSSQHDDYNT